MEARRAGRRDRTGGAGHRALCRASTLMPPEGYDSVTPPAVTERHRLEGVKRSVNDRYERLEQSRSVGPLVAISKRFVAIDGFSHGGLLAVELFTTVIPLMILGF